VPEFATREAPIVEPEALPDLPVPGEPDMEPPPVPEPEPEPIVAEAEPQPEPEPVPEPVVAEAEPEPVPTWDEPAEVKAEEPAAAEPAPEPEPVPEEVAQVVATEPSVPTWDEHAAEVKAEEPPAEPEPAPEPEREPEPGPASVSAGVEAVAEPAAKAQPDVSSTLVAWPTSSAGAGRENGTPAESGSFEEATSVIPAWRQTDPSADPRRTVSLQAMPPEEVASGTGYAALLTFESGPFAGRIVALPSQMVTIGRAPDNDVVVGDPATSGHHGRIEVRAGSFWISDLGSTNGTLVNGESVIEKQLSDGDMIAIGQSTLRFTLEA
jgi:FHA domain-containing protein